MVWQVAQALPKLPIVGMGGIMNATDAVEFFLAGATAVSVGTANFVNPTATIDVIEGLEKWLVENDVRDVNHLIGAVS